MEARWFPWRESFTVGRFLWECFVDFFFFFEGNSDGGALQWCLKEGGPCDVALFPV